MLRVRLLAVPLAALIGAGFVPSVVHASPVASGPAAAVATASAAKPAKSVLRLATFNVRTARATGDKRTWLKRAPDVAREILSRSPGIVALQELGPGRADGKTGQLKGHMRQTTSLMSQLKRLGGSRYKLVRETAYVKSGTKHGTQGARILYDSTKFKLMTNCKETTGKKNYNGNCAFDLPIKSGDSKKLTRSAAWAEFTQKSNGHRFFVVSAHLDPRHSGSNKKEAGYNALRSTQARAVANKLARINTKHRPVIFGGDINAWAGDRGNYAPHRALASKGYVDTAAASTKINFAYTTVNHFDVTLKKSKDGSGSHLDVITVKKGKGATRYENKMARVDHARPSDHNMTVADILL
jgi:endonuclease/exonuclease/phosphatase family metal-dependent hydrolase